MAVSNDTTNTTVHRYTEEGTVLSTERAACARCGAEGWRGDWSDEGGIVPDEGGRLVCDTCAVMGEEVTEESASEALELDGHLPVNAGEPRSVDYDEGMILEVHRGKARVSWQGSGDLGWTPLEGLRHGHPGLWSQDEEA